MVTYKQHRESRAGTKSNANWIFFKSTLPSPTDILSKWVQQTKAQCWQNMQMKNKVNTNWISQSHLFAKTLAKSMFFYSIFRFTEHTEIYHEHITVKCTAMFGVVFLPCKTSRDLRKCIAFYILQYIKDTRWPSFSLLLKPLLHQLSL